MSDNYSQFINVFITEAEENIKTLEEEILNLEDSPEDDRILNTIFRAAHTIKGSAGLVGIKPLQDFTHKVEDFLDVLRNKTISINENIISVILHSIDIIKAMLENVKTGGQADDEIDTSSTLKQLNDYLNQEEETEKKSYPSAEKTTSIAQYYYYIKLKFREDIFTTGTDPLMYIDDLAKIGELLYISIDTKELKKLVNFNPQSFNIHWKIFLKSTKPIAEVKDLFLFVIDDNDIKINELTEAFSQNDQVILNKYKIDKKIISDITDYAEPIVQIIQDELPKEPPLTKQTLPSNEKIEVTSFIKIETNKLDNLLNMVSELVIAQSQLKVMTNTLQGMQGENLKEISTTLDKLSRGLQEQTMQLRMISLGPTLHQFKRLVRDTVQEFDKKAKLIITGDETELDKNMISKISDPLKHMLRNAIDHGLENIETRKNNNKVETGTIELNAYYEESNVVIEVKDDGAGINKDKLLKKAIEKGIIEPTHQLNDNEILNLIFHPGLSTADKITDISGRGVGMDVVANNIKSLNGNIEINSELGKGTSFKMKLPLTLAITDGMLTKVGDQVFIVPITSIEESYRPSTVEIKTVEGKGELFKFRQDYISLIRLHDIFHIDNAQTNPTKGLLIIIKFGNTRIALLVDSILDQQQVVMKALGNDFQKIEGIASATILGTGKVALILDTNSLISYAFDRHKKTEAAYVHKI